MVMHTRILAACLLLLLHSLAWAVNLEVKLDAAEITTGDTVNLTVTVDEQAFGKAPDFAPLKQSFEILSNRQSSQYSMVNGKISSSTSWILTLLPKTDGFIAIPGIEYGDQTSKPLKLHVTQRRQADAVNTSEIVFLDAQVDKTDVYVQEQIIYTVRLYRRIDLHESNYSAPKVDNAVMEPLGTQREYTSTVQGRGYKIVELRYVIFPQKSGELEIPPAEITGTIFLASNNSFLLDPFNGKQIRRASPRISINVKSQPASYPADKPWLPARSLSLQEIWKPEDPDFQVGTPVTRSIVMEAEGLAPSVLPPIRPPSYDYVKVYPEQAETSSKIGPRGLLSTRVENLALIATRSGEINLPPVEVTWWDVDEEKVKIAALPARSFNISGTAASLQTDAPLQAPVVTSATDAVPDSLGSEGSSAWQWIALLALLLWLLTLGAGFWFWRKRQQSREPAPAAEVPVFSRAAEKAGRQQFHAACASGDARSARTALIEWYRQHFHNAQIHNLDDIVRLTPDDDLASQLQQLDTTLYRTGKPAPAWNGSELEQAVQRAMNRQQQASVVKPHLEPLYPA